MPKIKPVLATNPKPRAIPPNALTLDEHIANVARSRAVEARSKRGIALGLTAAEVASANRIGAPLEATAKWKRNFAARAAKPPQRTLAEQIGERIAAGAMLAAREPAAPAIALTAEEKRDAKIAGVPEARMLSVKRAELAKPKRRVRSCDR